MGLPGGLSPLVFAGVAVLGLGVLLHIVGMATPEWSDYGLTSFGPYRACLGSNCVGVSSGNSEYDAVRAMTMIGTLAGLGALGLAILFIVFAVMNKSNKLFSLLTLAAAGVSFLFILLGVIIWGAAIHNSVGDIGYSFALSIVGGILVIAGGVLVFLGGKGVEVS